MVELFGRELLYFSFTIGRELVPDQEWEEGTWEECPFCDDGTDAMGNPCVWCEDSGHPGMVQHGHDGGVGT